MVYPFSILPTQILPKIWKMHKVVISDTSCLIILSNIQKLDILNKLYGEILTTPEVSKEFGEPLPEWVKIKSPHDTINLRAIEQQIDKGEASAIALALETKDCIIILDDLKARKVAANYKLKVTGTLAVLIMAYEKRIISSMDIVLKDLKTSGFRISEKVEAEILSLINKDK